MNKKKRLIEYVNEDPFYVISKVFKTGQDFTCDQLEAWLYFVLETDCPEYSDAEQQEQLKVFHKDLLALVDALFLIHLRDTENSEEPISYAYKISSLAYNQIVNPEHVITAFFGKYQKTYIMRELEEWFEAALCSPDPWPDDLFCIAHLLDVHRYVHCLIKSAEQLIIVKI